MSDLMSTYIPDLVLKIDSSNLSEIVKHLPEAHKSFLQTAVMIGTPIITAATSIVTAIVLIANRSLTKDVAKINYELAKQQSLISIENKEIAKSKYNLDIMNHRWFIIKEYITNFNYINTNVVIDSVENYIDVYEKREINYNTFYKIRLTEMATKRKYLEKIKSVYVMMESFSSKETKESMNLLERKILILLDKIEKFELDEKKSEKYINTADLLIEYQEYISEYMREVELQNSVFVSNFIRNELGGISLMK